MNQFNVIRLSTLALAMGLTGCVTTQGGSGGALQKLGQSFKETFANDDPCANNARNIGTAVGIGLGVLVATQVDAKAGQVAAVALGGLIGNLIGADIDKKRCEISKIAKENNLNVEFVPIKLATPDGSEAFSMTLRDEHEQFAQNSDKLTPRATAYFQKIAQQYVSHELSAQQGSAEERAAWKAKMNERKLLLIGHTDDTGSSAVNAKLSESRAQAVANLLSKNGVPRSHIYFQGAGEGYPVATNETEEGRAKNRRVEFVEVYGDTALRAYLDSRRANYALYRTTSTEHGQQAAKPSEKTKSKAASKAVSSVDETKPSTHNKGTPSEAKTTSIAATPQTSTTTHRAPAKPPVLDFGGILLEPNTPMVNLGTQTTARTGFSFLSTAHASNNSPFIARCDLDRPRKIGEVKSLNSGKTFRTIEYLNGLHGTSWAQTLNGNLVVLHKVAVLRDGTSPESPKVNIYKNYEPSNSKNAKAFWTGSPDINVYQGEKGILYRVFLTPSAGAECLDILFPENATTEAKDGRLIYGQEQNRFVVDFKPSKRN